MTIPGNDAHFASGKKVLTLLSSILFIMNKQAGEDRQREDEIRVERVRRREGEKEGGEKW